MRVNWHLFVAAGLMLAASGSTPAFSQNSSQGAIIVSCGDADPNCEGAAARYRYEQEQARKAARLKPKIDEMTKKLGDHRRAEAERFVQMQEAAAEARKKRRHPNPACNSPTLKVSCE